MSSPISDPFEKNHCVKCKNLYRTLLLCNDLNDKRDQIGMNFISFLFLTKKCDDVSDFSDLRKKYETYLAKHDTKLLERILNYDTKKQDVKIITQAFIHYHSYQTNKLITTLNPIEKFCYYINKASSFMHYGSP